MYRSACTRARARTLPLASLLRAAAATSARVCVYGFASRIIQPVVLRDGVLEADGAVGGVGGVRGVVGPVGREHVRRLPHGGVLAAVRLAGPRLLAPPGLCVRVFAVRASRV